MYPMGSSGRWWLNHDTHSSVANSTASLVFHGAPAVNQVGLVQAIDGLGQGVVAAVALAAHRRLDVMVQ